MEEKILVKSQQYNIKRGLLITGIALVILAIAFFVIFGIDYSTAEYMEEWTDDCNRFSEIDWSKDVHYLDKWLNCLHGDGIACVLEHAKDARGYAKCRMDLLGFSYINNREIGIIMLSLLGCVLLALFFYLWARKFEMVVTDKRVYGKAAFGKRIDLPMDSISAVGTSLFKGVDVATSSGRIKFKFIKNQDEMHSSISKLLNERQSGKKTKNEDVQFSSAEELKKYKELFDSGIITEEEFDAKKKQLLNM